MVALGLLISIAGTVFFVVRAERWLEIALFALLDVLFVAGVAEGLTARVTLGAEALEIVSNFKRTIVPRDDLLRVVGEKGVPVALERRSGGWVRLPSLGSGPHPNTVRAWIRRTPPPSAGPAPLLPSNGSRGSAG
jgi:hypothetical protein